MKSKRDKSTQWDWAKNYGRNAYRSARNNYTPPTQSLECPHKKGSYFTTTSDIHEQFRTYWEAVYCLHDRDANIWETFDGEYGMHIPNVEYDDKPYEASEFIEQLARMKDSAAGFDGWTKKALQLLPEQAWQDRAELENVAKTKGVLPQAYSHVPLAMLPKGQAVGPQHHRGITIFSMVHRVVYGALWQRLKLWQEKWIDDAQHGGRIEGEHLADAWDLQIAIEHASTTSTPIVGALLDYEKFFDRFHPNLVRGMMLKAGIPQGIAEQLHSLYCNLKRYVRVAGSYGAVIEQTNGIGQGCSLSIIIANLYVATLFRLLRSKFPELQMGAFLDDRNFTSDNECQLMKAIVATRSFDRAAGHNTNLKKSAVFANEQRIRDSMRKTTLDGNQLPVTINENMVGHQIAAGAKRNIQNLSSRTTTAASKATKISCMATTRKNKTKLIQGAVIPSAVSGTLWDIPSKRSLNLLRTETLNAIWGK